MRAVDADELRKHAFTVYQGNGIELEPIEVVPLTEIDNASEVEINKWLDPDIDPELALENIRRIVYG